MKKIKIQQLENKNQFTLQIDNQLYFQSYNSICALIENEELTLFSDWNYSNTTRKHLYLFLEYNFNYFYKKYLMNSKNKAKTLRNMIKNNVVKYSEEY